MKTIRDVSDALRDSVTRQAIRQADLKALAGISQRTLTNVLSGKQDFKVSTLLALSDRLGFELVLVPKGVSAAVEAGPTAAPLVKSRVEAALERVRRAAEPVSIREQASSPKDMRQRMAAAFAREPLAQTPTSWSTRKAK